MSLESKCGKVKKQRSQEFHTDYFRAIDAGDIMGSKIPWFKSEVAKKDIEMEVSKLTGGAPRGGKARQSGEAQGHGVMSWTGLVLTWMRWQIGRRINKE